MRNKEQEDKLVCVLIVSYNFEPWIEKCIESIQASTIKSSILVVDNKSSDFTCAIIKEKYPEVSLITNKENVGFGAANNIGMKQITDNGYKYAFLLNQDARIEPDTIEKLIKVADNHPEYGIISPIHLNGKGDSTDYGFYHYTNIEDRQDALSQANEVITYDFVNAAMWVISVEVWKEVGGFAKIFSHYGEDVNWTQRALNIGYKTGVVTNAFGYHDRENRQPSRERFFYSEFVYFLTEAVNPLHSDVKAFAYSILASVKKAAKSLLKGRTNDAKEYISIANKLIKMSDEIKITRRETDVR